MPAHFNASTAVLVVDEIEPTRTFFVDRLGFAVRASAAGSGQNAFTIVERGGVAIMIQSAANLYANAIETFDPGPYKALVYVEVDDVELLVPEVIDVDIVLPLRKTAHGSNEIGVREPGGNIIVFASRLAS